MQRFEEILCFWFGGLEEKDFAELRKSWFAVEPDFDAEIRRLFLDDYNRAARVNSIAGAIRHKAASR